MSNVHHEATSSTGLSADVLTTVAENVAVRSVVSTETHSKVNTESTQKMAALMSKLGTTHSQIDEYSRSRTEKISEEVTAAIAQTVANTQIEQANLLADANVRSVAIENECRHRLQGYVDELDLEKAQHLAALERDLNVRQEMILEQARGRIDKLNEEANRLKMNVLNDAQAQIKDKVETITDEVAALSAEDASHRMASTTTTVITTKAKSSDETHLAGTSAIVDSATTSNETWSEASSSVDAIAATHK